MPRLVRILVLLTVAAILSSCGFKKGIQTAGKSVETFHQQFNESHFAEIYSTATPAFKSVSKEPDFLKFITLVRTKLGPFKSTSRTGFNVNATTGGTIVVLTQSTTFEKGSAVETFTFLVSDETASLQGYNVNSSALITN